MPRTNDLRILIDGQEADTGGLDKSGVSVSYALEDPENFEQKQASMSLGITLPSTNTNDKIFNSFYRPGVEDMTQGDYYTNPRACSILAGGIEILRGKSMLQSASHTRLGGGYNINCYGQNGDWSIEMKDLTLWHCLSDTPHTFDLATVEGSWLFDGTSEANDFVYAPVRYRQPFGNNDDTVSVYHLRPSLSIYWMIYRAFRLMGYKLKSAFMDSNYFRRQVMPWVWGDFYNINGQVAEGMKFKAAGVIPTQALPTDGIPAGYSEFIFFAGAAHSTHPADDADNTGWTPWRTSGDNPPTSGYVFTRTQNPPLMSTKYHNFEIKNVAPPRGFDNFNLYSFDSATGKMMYTFNPPASLVNNLAGPTAINFRLNLICKIKCQSSASPVYARMYVEHSVVPVTGPTVVNLINIPELSTTTSGATVGSLITPTIFDFTVPNVNPGDRVEIRLYYDHSAGITDSIGIICSGYVNVDPGTTGANNWQFNHTTGEWGYVNGSSSGTTWQHMQSSIEITGMELLLGGQVNFKNYDKLRNYKVLDLLRGLVDMYNLSIQTNPIAKEVTIEPTHEYKTGGGTVPLSEGYFKRTRLDWTNKQDLSKENAIGLFSDMERQLDFQFKQDGSDGGQNIYAARYRGIYLNNTVTNRINNTNIDNGIYAGVPGAARYMFPMRFRKGARQMTNRFFSATMHYQHSAWKDVFGPGSPAPYLITIFPDNINDSSASAVTQTFEPKIAYYKGPEAAMISGGWRFEGDPASPYPEPTAVSFNFPQMFAVNYATGGENDPVLTYCDQKINGVRVAGLVRAFFLKRMAIMRHGRQYRPWVHLNNGDITNWLHRERIIIDGAVYNLIGIDQYNPVTDNSTQVTLWKDVQPEQADVAAVYPSADALDGVAILGQFDMRYAPLVLFNTDIPQVYTM